MSITSARSFIEKSGCGWIVGVGLAVVFVFSLFSTGMFSGNDRGGSGEEKAIPIVEVGGQAVALQTIERTYQATAGQALGMEGGPPPDLDAEVYGESLSQTIRAAAQRSLAARHGVKVSDDKIVESALKRFDDQLALQRQLLMATGQIKANATEVEIQQALRQVLGGKDVASARADVQSQVLQALKDPSARAQLESGTVGAILIDAVGSTIQLPDEQLKKDLETVVTKRVAFDSTKNPSVDLVAKANKVLSEIKGGLSFEAAMNRYSDDPPPAAGKPKSESTVNLTRGNLSYDDAYEPLRGLKPGDVSPVVLLNTGPAIFKIIKFDSKLPADFETTKAERKKTRIREMAIKQIQRDIEELVKPEKLKWQSEGFKVLYEWHQKHHEPELVKDQAKMSTAMKEIAEKAKSAMEGADSWGMRPARLTWFVALNDVYKHAGESEKAKLRDEWLDAAQAALQDSENVDLRIEITRTFLAAKNLEKAVENLSAAAQANSGTSEQALKRHQDIVALEAKLQSAGVKKEDLEPVTSALSDWKMAAFEELRGQAELNTDYGDAGRQTFADVNKKVEAFRSAGIISPAQVSEIEKLQEKWKSDKAKEDELAAQEAKKQKEEAKKAEEEAKKQAGKPSSGTTGPPKAPSSSDLGGAAKSGG